MSSEVPCGKTVDITLRHLSLSHQINAQWIAPSTSLQIGGLYSQGNYRIHVDPPSYYPVSRFVSTDASGDTSLEIRFPIDFEKVKGVDFPPYSNLPAGVRTLLDNSDSVSSFPRKSGMSLYDSLDSIRRSSFLNITTKSRAVLLQSGNTVLSYINKIRVLRRDRFFAEVSEDLQDEVKNSADGASFREVDGSLHDLPPAFEDNGFRRQKSFKNCDNYGNLQLTFFGNSKRTIADIDIDEAGGLKHLFEVARNKLSGRTTHPYDIHQILVRHQELDPGYRFKI